MFASFISWTAPALASPPDTHPADLLENYLQEREPPFRFFREKIERQDRVSLHHLHLFSQVWQPEPDEVDRPLWEHDLTLIVPEQCSCPSVLLFVVGGFRGQENRFRVDPAMIELARMTKSRIALVRQVPNQPLCFHQEPNLKYADGRGEDSLIAYGWDRFLATQNPRWLVRFPMTKAVVRAMDTLEEYNQQLGLPLIDGFYLTGRSKRGWTAWTAATMDRRVKGMIPVVIDLLSLKASFERHYQAYGTWSFALNDYVEMGIPEQWNSPHFDALLDLIEPFRLGKDLTIPKYLINSAGDEFFLPDSSRLYFNQLKGTNYLRYIPNSSHSLAGSDATKSLAAFYQALVTHAPLPTLSWTNTAKEVLVSSETSPKSVKVWRAYNPEARDFRFSTIGNGWESESLDPKKQTWTIPLDVRKPTSLEQDNLSPGWSALFVELTFPTQGPFPLIFTTDVFVTPEDLPYDLPSPATLISQQGE